MRSLTVCAFTATLLVASFAPRLAAQSVLYTIPGTAALQNFGTAVAAAGDVDADGFPDFIVGAAGDDTNGLDAGAAFVYSGDTGGLIWSWFGGAAGDGMGFSVDGAGDVNDDGNDDVIVGAFRYDGVGANSGRALVFSGLDGSTIWALEATGTDDEFGVGVAGVGDLDSDDHDDIAVGAHHDDDNGGNCGSVRVFSGATAGQLHLFLGDDGGEDLGHVLSGLGDISGDGVPDLIAGLHDTLHSGQARVYSGANGAVLHNFVGTTSHDFFGHAVAGPGDVNRDGVPDMLIGAELDDTSGAEAGRAWLRSGATGGILLNWVGDVTLDSLGSSVSGAGDWNGDGVLDVIIGAPGNDTGGPGASIAKIFSGLDGTLLHTHVGSSTGPRSDIRVAGLGDVNGDTRPDVLIAQQFHDGAFTDAGRAVVISGAEPSWTLLGGGLAGTTGIPLLVGTGTLAHHSAGNLRLSQAKPTALSLLLVSLANNPTAFKCGTMITFPIAFQLVVFTGPGGGKALPWSNWPGGLSGVSLYFQFAVLDPAAVCGVAISNALRADVP